MTRPFQNKKNGAYAQPQKLGVISEKEPIEPNGDRDLRAIDVADARTPTAIHSTLFCKQCGFTDGRESDTIPPIPGKHMPSAQQTGTSMNGHHTPAIATREREDQFAVYEPAPETIPGADGAREFHDKIAKCQEDEIVKCPYPKDTGYHSEGGCNIAFDASLPTCLLESHPDKDPSGDIISENFEVLGLPQGSGTVVRVPSEDESLHPQVSSAQLDGTSAGAWAILTCVPIVISCL